MSVVHELFGTILTTSGANTEQFREAQCPHMATLCDGGGNRDMMRWPASEQPLAPFFDAAVGVRTGGFIPCGVCSVEIADRNWAVCPRRLLSFEASEPSSQQRPLWNRVLQLGGFKAGDTVQVWSEISLRDSSGLNYRLDYVLRADERPPIIVEVMTASTSGGNRRQRTDMQSAFCDAVLYANGLLSERRLSPGVNARQVWARMASQLVVKSEVANGWGGRAIWVVQDTLMEYIGRQTGLRLDELYSPDWKTGEVNVVAASIDDPSDIQLYSGPIHSQGGEACWTELLSTPSLPEMESLTSRLTDDRAIATLRLPASRRRHA